MARYWSFAMKTFALATLEQILNKLLQLDPEIGRLFAPLDSKTIAITLEGLNLTIYCYFSDDKICLMRDCYTAPDAKISGTPIALLAAKQDTQAAAAQGKITIDGDDETIQAFHRLIQELQIDWEEVLSKVLGDTMATTLSRFARKLKQTGNGSAKAFAMNVSEYLQYEINILPPKQEIDDFCNDVDKLRNDAERLCACWRQVQFTKGDA